MTGPLIAQLLIRIERGLVMVALARRAAVTPETISRPGHRTGPGCDPRTLRAGALAVLAQAPGSPAP